MRYTIEVITGETPTNECEMYWLVVDNEAKRPDRREICLAKRLNARRIADLLNEDMEIEQVRVG